MPKVSEAYKVEKRNHILDSAMVCFANKGYEKASMDDIVAEAGMSKGALYNYFNSKEAVYLSLLERNTERTFETLSNGFKDTSEATEKIKKLLQLLAKPNFEDEKWIGNQRVHLEFWVNSSQNEELRQAMVRHAEKFHQFMKGIIEEGKSSGEFKQDLDSQMVSEMFWSIHDGIRLHLLVHKEAYPFSNAYKYAEKMFLVFIESLKNE